MCGRYTLLTNHQALGDLFEATTELGDYLPRHNIAPTQLVPIVRETSTAGQRSLVNARWGLIPGWRKDPTAGPLLLNARAESAAEKASFCEAYRNRRCIVPASGFYEWKAVQGGKVPHYIHRLDGEPLAMAGLWELWQGQQGPPITSCAVLTVPAREPVSLLHDRMPAIISSGDLELWLAPSTPMEIIDELLDKPPPALQAWPVSRRVNRVENDDPQCVQRQEPAQRSLF